jgi:hypothetical protein
MEIGLESRPKPPEPSKFGLQALDRLGVIMLHPRN